MACLTAGVGAVPVEGEPGGHREGAARPQSACSAAVGRASPFSRAVPALTTQLRFVLPLCVCRCASCGHQYYMKPTKRREKMRRARKYYRYRREIDRLFYEAVLDENNTGF